MCLIDTKQFRYAEQDIPIFKVVYNYKNKYYLPFYPVKLWRINNFSYGKEKKLKGKSEYSFNDGFWHACISRKLCEKLIIDVCCKHTFDLHNSLNKFLIIDEYIPEGTRYAQDNFGNICAKKNNFKFIVCELI